MFKSISLMVSIFGLTSAMASSSVITCQYDDQVGRKLERVNHHEVISFSHCQNSEKEKFYIRLQYLSPLETLGFHESENLKGELKIRCHSKKLEGEYRGAMGKIALI